MGSDTSANPKATRELSSGASMLPSSERSREFNVVEPDADLRDYLCVYVFREGERELARARARLPDADVHDSSCVYLHTQVCTYMHVYITHTQANAHAHALSHTHTHAHSHAHEHD